MSIILAAEAENMERTIIWMFNTEDENILETCYYRPRHT